VTATIDNKGIASGFSDGEDGWGTFMNQNMLLLSAMVLAGFANDIFTTTGLTYGYKSGTGVVPGGIVTIGAGTVTLAASSTNYVIRTVAGVVSATTSTSFADKILLATVTTNASVILTIVDNRYAQDITQDGTLRVEAIAALVNPSTTGYLRLANAQAVNARNVGNTADLELLRLGTDNQVHVAGIASGVATIFGGPATVGGQLNTLDAAVIQGPTAPNGTLKTMLRLDAGADVTLNSLYLQLFTTPTATGANRIWNMQVGDAAALRKFAAIVSQYYIGTNTTPSFIGSEQLRVEGSLRADGVNAGTGSFSGNGSGLTSIPSAAVVNLDTNLSSIFSSLGTLSATDAAYNTRITAVEAARPFLSVVNDNVPVSRVNFGGAIGYSAQTVNNLLGGRTAALTQPPTTTGTDLQTAIVRINDVLINLVNDLKARGVI
jgi:hypothetical protein